MSQNIGKIISAKGPVIDIQFDGDNNLPALNTAIEIQNGDELLVVEVAQHIGDDVVRCVAMGPTDGVKRGMDALNTGNPISVPVGNETLGRMFNVLGQPIDGKEALGDSTKKCQFTDLHRHMPNKEQKLKFLKRELKQLI